MRRRYFSLIEVLIAMSIAMGLLVTGLYFYRYAAFMDSKLQQEEGSVLKSRLFAARLSYVFSHLDKKPLFFTTPEIQGLTRGPSLIFTYYEQSRDPRFHGKVLARLFVDPDKRLFLAVWPFKEPRNPMPPMHYEVLAENISQLDFELLAGPSTPQLPQGTFLSEWKAEYEKTPVALKIYLKGKERVAFAFLLVEAPAEAS